MLDKINYLYEMGIYPYHVPYADYVDIRIGRETIAAPASNALLAVQFTAKEINFTGKVTVEYRLDPNGNPCYNEFLFTNGTITSVNKYCSYSVYGQDQVLRKLKIA